MAATKPHWPKCGCSPEFHETCDRIRCRVKSNDRESYRAAASTAVVTGVHRGLLGRKYKEKDLKRLINAAKVMPVPYTICRTTGISHHSLKCWLKLSRDGVPGDRFDIHIKDEMGLERVERFHVLFEDAMEEGFGRIEENGVKYATGMAREVLEHHGQLTRKIDPVLKSLGFPEHECYITDKETGEPVYETKNVTDTEMIRWFLARRKSEQYGQKQVVDHNFRGGVVVLAAPMTAKQLEHHFGGEQKIVDVEFEAIPSREQIK